MYKKIIVCCMLLYSSMVPSEGAGEAKAPTEVVTTVPTQEQKSVAQALWQWTKSWVVSEPKTSSGDQPTASRSVTDQPETVLTLDDLFGQADSSLDEKEAAPAAASATPVPKLKEKPLITLGDQTVKPYQELLAKFSRFDSLTLRYTVKPLLRKVFPIDEYQALLKDIIAQKAIPADIFTRIESIVKKMTVLGDSQGAMSKAAGVLLAKQLIVKNPALETYINQQIPVMQQVLQATEIAQTLAPDISTILEEFSKTKNPEELLINLHSKSLRIFKEVPLKQAIDTIASARTQGIGAADQVLSLANVYHIYLSILFGLGLGNLICSIVIAIEDQDSKKRALAQHILEYMAIIDALALLAGLGTKIYLVKSFHNFAEPTVSGWQQYSDNIAKLKESLLKIAKPVSQSTSKVAATVL